MILQVTGVASILPFMQLVSQPGIVERSEPLGWVYEFIGFESERQMLFWTGVLVFTLFTASVLMTALFGWLMQRSIWTTAHRLCLRQLRTYMQLPYEFFLATSSTELLRRVVADINKLLNDVLLAGIQLLAQTLLAFGLFALMFFLHAEITLIAIVVFGGIYGLIQLLRHSYLRQLGQERIDTDDLRYSSFVDAVTGMKSIRTADASEFFISRFGSASRHYSQLYPRLDLLTKLPQHFMEILAFGGILLVVLTLVGSERDLVEFAPTLSMFALATYRLMPALHTIFDSAARLSSSLPVIRAIAQDLAPGQTLTDLPEPGGNQTQVHNSAPGAYRERDNLPFEHEIRLRGLSFQYANSAAPALQNIDIRIKKRTRVALVGATGSGKTTLVDLAVGLLLPSAGALLIDEQAVTAENLSAWRKHIAYVPQDVFLYDDSVANNIAFGHRDYDLHRIVEAAQIAQLDDFVTKKLSEGYQTVVGERGSRLSGGERQRIGIARALYRRPQVLLLDEATSALDNVTEAALMSALGHEQPDMTVISIAHRLSTISDFNHIYLLECGHIVDEGTYAELYKRNSNFKKMVDVRQDAGLVPTEGLLHARPPDHS
jgi:ATP-binding cassette subfamily C protein